MKNIQKLLHVLVMSIPIIISGQTPIFKYAYTGTDANIESMEVDSNGNVYSLGDFYGSFGYRGDSVESASTDTVEGPGSLFVLKTNASGQKIYLARISGTDRSLEAYNAKIASNEKGGLAITFPFDYQKVVKINDRTITVDSAHTKHIVAKFSKNGFLEWVKPIKSNEGSYFDLGVNDINLDESGNVYLTGYFLYDTLKIEDKIIKNIINGEKMMFVAKINNKSQVDWISGCAQQSIIDTAGIKGNLVEVGPNGNVCVFGELMGDRSYLFGGKTIKNMGSVNAFVACYDSSGSSLWVNQLESNISASTEDIATNKLGEVVVASFFNGTVLNVGASTINGDTNTYNLAVVKFNSFGALQMLDYIPANHSNVDDFQQEAFIGIDNQSYIYLAHKDFLTGTDQIAFRKYTSANNVEFEYTTTSTNFVNLSEAVFDKDYRIYFRGYTYNNAPFNLHTETVDVVPGYPGYQLNFFGRISNTGIIDYIYDKVNTDSSHINLSGLGADKYGGCYLVGSFGGSTGTPRLNGHVLGSIGTYGMFVARYNYTIDVSGTIKTSGGTIINDGFVRLIGYTYKQRSPFTDSVAIKPDGKYVFHDVPFGKYLLVAETDYTDDYIYLPTYYISTGHWSQAEHLVVDSPTSQDTIDILMRPVSVQAGSGTLAGNVTEVDEDDIFKSVEAKPHKEGVATLARSKTKSTFYEIIATSPIDENGNYSFGNVADGDYFIFVDVPGIPHEDVYEVTVSGGNYIKDLDYLVGEETIIALNEDLLNSGAGEEVVLTEQVNFRIYPNPSSGEISFIIPENEFINTIIIQDIQGKVVRELLDIDNSIVVSGLDSGIYFARITTNKSQETVMFIVNE